MGAHTEVSRVCRAVLLCTAGSIFGACNNPDARIIDDSIAGSVVIGAGVQAAPAATNPLVLQVFANKFPGAPRLDEIDGLNDEQRLSTKGRGGEYGPIARLYVAPVAASSADFDKPGGALVALLEVGPTSGTLPATYNALRIKRSATTQVYCVLLHRKRNERGWWGYVTPVVGVDCEPISNPNRLRADSIPDGANTDNADFPNVVRFTDDNGRNPNIGVKCVTSWCEIGHAANPRGPRHPHRRTAQERIKAWQDEQELSAPGPLRRSVSGSITPVQGLAAIKEPDYASGRRRVANINLAANPLPGTKYHSWGLQAGDNAVWMVKQGVDWKAQFVPGGGAPTNNTAFRVTRRGHPSAPPIPGIARWVWSELDEEAWVACDQGCCTISQDPSPITAMPLELGGARRNGGRVAPGQP